MSAKNYLSAREKARVDCLPQLGQPSGFRQELPSLHPKGYPKGYINRNIYPYEGEHFAFDEGVDRSGTPLSDFFSESETGTPDICSEESDSSAGSTLQRNTDEATQFLTKEWEKIECTIYDEDGEKTTKPQLLEECQQWKMLHPQLRVVGRGLKLPARRPACRAACRPAADEVLAMHYSDYEEFSESDDRLSQSSGDVTPRNSPRASAADLEPPLHHRGLHSEYDMPAAFCSLLHITPITIRSPRLRRRQNSSILKSEAASSRWMRRPDSSVDADRTSARSFVSLDPEYGSARKRVVTARQGDFKRLEPLYSETQDMPRFPVSVHQAGGRKVSLPPLLLEEEKRKMSSVNSARKRVPTGRSKGSQKSAFRFVRS